METPIKVTAIFPRLLMRNLPLKWVAKDRQPQLAALLEDDAVAVGRVEAGRA